MNESVGKGYINVQKFNLKLFANIDPKFNTIFLFPAIALSLLWHAEISNPNRHKKASFSVLKNKKTQFIHTHIYKHPLWMQQYFYNKSICRSLGVKTYASHILKFTFLSFYIVHFFFKCTALASTKHAWFICL